MTEDLIAGHVHHVHVRDWMANVHAIVGVVGNGLSIHVTKLGIAWIAVIRAVLTWKPI